MKQNKTTAGSPRLFYICACTHIYFAVDSGGGFLLTLSHLREEH